MSKQKVETRHVLITVVGMTLWFVALGSVAAGAIGWDQDHEGYILAGNVGVGLSCLGMTGLVGFYERDPAIWHYGRAWGFGLVGLLFLTAALVNPWVTGWLFTILVELI